ncbi:MAG: FIST signal transduction protein [Alphaproteobacteria bacterium]
MSLFTSSHFASACAAGTDWRDTSKNVLEKLDGIRTDNDDFNFGILYISDYLADDVTSILNLFKSVLKIDAWVGSVGMGVIGCSESFVDQPAISAMLCRFPENGFCLFPEISDENEALKMQHNVQKWVVDNEPLTAIVHGDPVADEDPRAVLIDMERSTNSFVIGGMSSSRSQHYQIAGSVFDNAISGAFLSPDIQIATALSQGCEPIGAYHTITKTDENVILEIDEEKALKVFQNDLRAVAAQNLGKNHEDFLSEIQMIENSDRIPPEFKSLFKGDVHIAFPRAQSDLNDYLVHNILGINPDEGSITVSDNVEPGETIFFVERNAKNIETDLTKSLIALQKRILHERGHFRPKAALYISCIARGFTKSSETGSNEIKIIHDVLGNIPMTGFYAGGEISNAQIYGYTGILTLFF